MRKIIVLSAITLAGLAGAAPAFAAQQAKQAQWKSTDEYNAYTAMAGQANPQQKVSLAEAFLQKYADSDFKDLAYVQEMAAYQQLGDGAKAVEAGQKAIKANPDNLPAIRYVSFAFPFVFKPNDPDAANKLTAAEGNAKHGLEALQKLQKPASATEEQFNQEVKATRAVFNGAIGFVAYQRKDYAGGITSYKAATEDNPSDFYAFYNMGLCYLYSTPRDYDHAVWNFARAVSLAKAAKDPNGDGFEKYLRQTYVGYHGNDQGLAEILTQAAASPTPPEGFKVAPMETPKATGNASIDAFNQSFFPLKYGGDTAQKTWDQIKGQPFAAAGFVDNVEKGQDAGVMLVRIAVLDQSKTSGSFDIELKDSTQPNVKNLSKGDAVHFQGTIASYTSNPNLVVTLDSGKINDDEIPDQPKAKAKPKPKPRPRTTTRRKPAQ